MFFAQQPFAQEHELKALLTAQVLRASKSDTSATDLEKVQERRCEMIEKHLGYEDTPMGKAMEYSCQAPQIGVAFYAGPDLGDYPPSQIERVILDKIGDNGLKAKFFTGKHEHASRIAFFVHGNTYLRNPVHPAEALEEVKNLTNETKLIFMTYKLITEWPRDKVTN